MDNMSNTEKLADKLRKTIQSILYRVDSGYGDDYKDACISTIAYFVNDLAEKKTEAEKNKCIKEFLVKYEEKIEWWKRMNRAHH